MLDVRAKALLWNLTLAPIIALAWMTFDAFFQLHVKGRKDQQCKLRHRQLDS
jgi:hypothetical protein